MMYRDNNKLVFTRRHDAEQYLQNLSEVIEKMSSDFAHVFQMVGIDLNEEDLLDIYFQLAEGPNTFERILIKEGTLTLEDCKKNYLTERLYQKLGELLGDELTSEAETNSYNLTRCPHCGQTLATYVTDTHPPMCKKICPSCGWKSKDGPIPTHLTSASSINTFTPSMSTSNSTESTD